MSTSLKKLPAPVDTREQDWAAWKRLRVTLTSEEEKNAMMIFFHGRESARLEYVYNKEVRESPLLLAQLAKLGMSLDAFLKLAAHYEQGPEAKNICAECRDVLAAAKDTQAIIKEIGKSL